MRFGIIASPYEAAMPQRTIAIGDIHGCAEALHALLEIVDPTTDDRIVTLGDYVDRGPNTREVIDQVLDLKKRCQLIPLTGNHELMMLDAHSSANVTKFDFWLHCGGEETMASYGGITASIPDDHFEFLKSCQRHYEIDSHFFVHANYLYHLPLDQQPDDVLFWQHLNDDPLPHVCGKIAILGHTPQLTGEILDLGHVVCIDTFCFGSGWLTAYDVLSGNFWQVDKLGNVRLDAQWKT